ncbi:MAG: hypothetical protein M0Z50_13070 [Planctomycetia bacterium]|nr:hypothetical protein [Planctomycetia bacterium]
MKYWSVSELRRWFLKFSLLIRQRSMSAHTSSVTSRRHVLASAALAAMAMPVTHRSPALRPMARRHNGIHPAPLPETPQALTLFTINEFDSTPHACKLSMSVPSQSWQRAWFKWGNAPDWQAITGDVQKAHQVGALFGGGTTCSALYPHENGITTAQFMNMATRDPHGKLFLVSNSYYHGSVVCPAYRRYVLHWAKLQIDAGVDTLFMDEVNGAYCDLEGYDSYGLAAFRHYLIRRFVQGEHWTIQDSRWKTQFGIDLSDSKECSDHSIRTFDYAAYLRKNHWADQPQQKHNPLSGVWGSPIWWGPSESLTEDTYCAWRNNSVWHYWVTHIRAYAARRHRRVWIAANGLNRWVDYQIGSGAAIWQFPRTPNGQLNCTSSYLSDWRSYYQYSKELLNGKEVPIMIFNDWGVGFPWMDKLTDAERVAWLRAYAPEIFAAGLFFAYPVLGPYNCNAATNGTLEVMRRQAQFVKMVSPLLRTVIWQDPAMAAYTGKAEITIQSQPNTHRLIVHLINRQYQGLTPIKQSHQILRLATARCPKTIRIHNADTGTVTAAKCMYDSQQRLLGCRTARITIPSLLTWNIVEVVL